jgi:1,4-alpha-glucan branching enzyme
MPAALEQISETTPMGANLTGAGATFRVWAPHAQRVHACVNGTAAYESNLLTADEAGHWRGFLPGVQDRAGMEFS